MGTKNAAGAALSAPIRGLGRIQANARSVVALGQSYRVKAVARGIEPESAAQLLRRVIDSSSTEKARTDCRVSDAVVELLPVVCERAFRGVAELYDCVPDVNKDTWRVVEEALVIFVRDVLLPCGYEKGAYYDE